MDESIKTIIENFNNTSLINEFVTMVNSIVPVFIPIAGGIGIAYFSIRIIRRILHV